MFAKILIANRGEIACRIIKTARRMGIRTVAVYSDADKRALHVQMADEAVRIGPAPAADSYLAIDRIIHACLRSGAEAVHPGYGFLSERAAFATAVQAAGVVFIGPNPGAIEAMGDKIESKRCANAAGVSTVPGHPGVVADPAEAIRIAEAIGYPIMIKASAGGGGKGMRMASSAAEVVESFARARSEAASSFGDDRLLVEKFIVDPRHIEIQVLGDRHGNVVYLGERECSIQRRNQKVIEEAPSPLLDVQTRKRMGEQAVALARSVGYDSAGTVEFVCGQDKSFYFLEMNTRLQVEHPVTEMITGIDLVEQMIHVAAGGVLAFGQEDIRLDGWAVESRIYAEDPTRSFMPAAGRLTTYRPPAEGMRDGATIRNDTGVYEGDEISVHYDPMIAKLVTHAATRAEAIALQAHALDAFAVDGIRHNIAFLAAVMRHPRWQAGRLSTAFIAEEFREGFVPLRAEGIVAQRMVAVAASMDALTYARRSGEQGAAALRRVVWLDATIYPVTVAGQRGHWMVHFDDAPDAGLEVVSNWTPGQPVWQGSVSGEPVAIQARRSDNGVTLACGGMQVEARVLSACESEMLALMPPRRGSSTGSQLRSPMPGIVVAICAEVGQTVATGDPLCVIEAMKMEITLNAQSSGVVSNIHVSPGSSLALDDVIIEFESGGLNRSTR
ncbi:MAG: acetyl/propionyl/methylcrotonyl-CoA carboxylase subunit alpha [Caldimonas sp.]